MEPYSVFVSLFIDSKTCVGQPHILMYQKTNKISDIRFDIEQYLVKMGSVEYNGNSIAIILDQVKLDIFQINLDSPPDEHEPIERKPLGKPDPHVNVCV
jgi:hypothetical protein